MIYHSKYERNVVPEQVATVNWFGTAAGWLSAAEKMCIHCAWLLNIMLIKKEGHLDGNLATVRHTRD